MSRYIDSLSRQLARLSMGLAALATLVMVASLLLGVFYRYVLQASLSWTGEVAVLAFTWVVFLMASVGVREGFHVRVTALEAAIPAPALIWLHRLSLLAIAGFGAVLLWSGYEFAVFTASQTSPAIRYPLWLRNAAVAVCGALVAIHALTRLVTDGRLDAATSGQDS